jgi:hypothetical protein
MMEGRKYFGYKGLNGFGIFEEIGGKIVLKEGS